MGSAPPAEHASARRRRRPAIRWLLLSGLAVVLGAGAAVALYGHEVSTTVVRAALGQIGIAPDRLEVRRLGPAGLVLGAISVPGGPSASGIEIGWSLRSLMHGRVTRVSIAGLTAVARVEDGRVTIGGLPSDGAGGGALTLPFERLELADAHARIIAPAAEIAVTANATVIAADRGAEGQARLAAVVTLDGGRAVRIEAHIPEWRLSQDGERWQVTVSGAEAALPEHELSAAEIDARLDMAGSGSASLSAEIRDASKPARFAPLALTVQGQRDGDVLVASGRVAAERGLVATFNGRHDLARSEATMDFAAGPVRFQPDGLQPDDIFPIAADMLRRVDGSVAARGTLAWRGALRSRLSLTLDNFSFETGIAKISEVKTTFALDSVMPPHTAVPQHVTGKLQVAGLPAAPVDLRLSLPGDDRLMVNAATLGLAGGTMAVSDLALRAGGKVDTAIEIKAVDLGAMLALAGIDGLSGSGTIEGRVPVRMDASGVAITSGELASTGPGIVRYTGAALPDGVAGKNAEGDAVRLLREALADFHYTSLMLTLDRDASGAGSLLVNLKGANPAVLDNHPFAINIRLEADFDRLAAILFNGFAAAEELMRRIKPP